MLNSKTEDKVTDRKTTELIATYLEESNKRDEARAQSYNPNRVLYNLYALAPIMGFAVAAANVSFSVALSFVGATWLIAGTSIIMDYSTGKIRHQFHQRAAVAREHAHKLRLGDDTTIPSILRLF